MRTYVHEYGIGPRNVYEFNPGNVSDMRARGEPVAWSWRLAIAQVGHVQWELVEPLDGESIYAQFLADHGPGVHHVGVGVARYDDTLAGLAARGQDGWRVQRHHVRVPLHGGRPRRDQRDLLRSAGDDQQPDAMYPPPTA